MEITDEMETVLKAIPDEIAPGAAAFQALRTYLIEHFVPIVAKAGVDDLLSFLDEKHPTIADDIRFALALRDKATPTDSTPQEK